MPETQDAYLTLTLKQLVSAIKDKYFFSYVRIEPHGFCLYKPLTLSFPWNTLLALPESVSLEMQFFRPQINSFPICSLLGFYGPQTQSPEDKKGWLAAFTCLLHCSACCPMEIAYLWFSWDAPGPWGQRTMPLRQCLAHSRCKTIVDFRKVCSIVDYFLHYPELSP